MTTLKFSSTAPDTTNATMVSTIWTVIEANTGIICSCSPMLKTPLARFFPHIFSRTGGTASATNPLSARRSWGPSAAAAAAYDNDGFPLRNLPPRAPGGSLVRNMNLDGGAWDGDVPAGVSSVVVGGVGAGGVGSGDRLVRGGGEGVPLGAISKTTDVQVHFHY